MISLLMMEISDGVNKTNFEKLYNLYKKHVYYIALKYLDNQQQAEDAAQITFFKAFCNIEKFENMDDYKTKGYIFTIAKRTAIDILRREKTNVCVTNEQEDALLKIEDNFSLEKEILKRETKKLVNSKMDDLSEVDRKLLKLKYIDEKKDKEIAEELGIPYDNVRVKITRARKRLALSLLVEKEDMFDEF